MRRAQVPLQPSPQNRRNQDFESDSDEMLAVNDPRVAKVDSRAKAKACRIYPKSSWSNDRIDTSLRHQTDLVIGRHDNPYLLDTGGNDVLKNSIVQLSQYPRRYVTIEIFEDMMYDDPRFYTSIMQYIFASSLIEFYKIQGFFSIKKVAGIVAVAPNQNQQVDGDNDAQPPDHPANVGQAQEADDNKEEMVAVKGLFRDMNTQGDSCRSNRILPSRLKFRERSFIDIIIYTPLPNLRMTKWCTIRKANYGAVYFSNHSLTEVSGNITLYPRYQSYRLICKANAVIVIISGGVFNNDTLVPDSEKVIFRVNLNNVPLTLRDAELCFSLQ
jgi:hypothetical protein